MTAKPRVQPTTAAAGAGGLAAVILLAAPVVAAWEGLSRDPYVDLAGVMTVCRGETSVPMRRYTVSECDAMFQRSLAKHAQPILDCLPTAAPTPVKAAFVSFGYNVGVAAACGSKAAQRARMRDYAGACQSLMNWTYVGKRRVQGLVNRRAAERDLCLQGVV